MPKRRIPSISSTLSSAASATTQPPTPIPSTFTDGHRLPRLLVFDLDYTLWPFWSDTHVTAPVRVAPKSNHSAMLDYHGERFTFYPEVPGILAAARARNIPLSLASRTSTPVLARDILRGLHISAISLPSEEKREDGGGRAGAGAEEEETTAAKDRRAAAAAGTITDKASEKSLSADTFFTHGQIYPGNKVSHFRRIHAATGVGYDEMIFFDDEMRNRNVETELAGVVFVLVRDGLTCHDVDGGIREWRRRRGFKSATVTESAGTEGEGEGEEE